MITAINHEAMKMSTAEALWVLIQSQTKAVRQYLVKKILAEDEKTKAQQKLVKESLTRAFDELHSGKVHHDARNLFSH